MTVAAIKNATLLLLCLILILPFQNCSDFSLQDQVLYDQGLVDSAKALDEKLLPGLLSSEALVLWSKPNNSTYVSKNIMADQWSIVAALDRTAVGQILVVNSTSGVDETQLSVTNGVIKAARINTGVPFTEYVEAPIPTQGSKMVIAASFGAKASEISLMVNGIIQTGTIIKSGTPGSFSYLTKQATSQLTTGQNYEYVVFAGDSSSGLGKLTGAELNVMSRNVATSNSISNVVLDPSLVQTPAEDIATTEFKAAKAIFDGKCISCHRSGGTSPNLSGLTQAKAVSSGLVLKKDPYNSKLYYRLKYSSGPNGPKNMPAESAADAQKIETWINSIN